MSQIGSEKGGLEMIGRLLGGIDGKAERVAAKLGGGASQDFARLMASAQGRLNGGQPAPSTASDLAKDGTVLSDQLRSALSSLGEEISRLRQQLASGTAGVLSDTAVDSDTRVMLDQMVEALSTSRGQGAVGSARQGDGTEVAREGLGRDARALAEAPMTDGPSIEATESDGRPGMPATGEAVSRSVSLERLATDETFASEVAGLAEALAGVRQALHAGATAEVRGATDVLRDRLVSLRESMQDGALASGDQQSGLVGQLQALQQLMARVETARPADAQVARGVGEPRAWSEWSWRLTGNGQQDPARSGTAAPASTLVAPDGDAPDWSGGPVTAALGLAGRDMPGQSRNDRLAPTHWSALGGLAAQSAEAFADTTTSPTGLGAIATPASSMSSGQSAGGIFTGQTAMPQPNPQMPAQLGQQIQWMVGKGVSRANIELRPADLGPLRISIETQGDETRIALTATNATTQGLLEQQLPRLKEWLQESGLAQSEVDVSLAEEGGFGQQLADADGGEPNDRDTAWGEAEGMAPAGASVEADGAVEWVEGQGVLDLFA